MKYRLCVYRAWMQSRTNSSTWWNFDISRFRHFNYVKIKHNVVGVPGSDYLYGYALAALDEDTTVWIQTSTSDVAVDDIADNNEVRRLLAEVFYERKFPKSLHFLY